MAHHKKTPKQNRPSPKHTNRAGRKRLPVKKALVRKHRVRRASVVVRGRVTRIGLRGTKRMLNAVFSNIHKKRRESLANYAVGAMQAVDSSISIMGAAYAAVAGITPKAGVKQVDRYLSNKGIQITELTPQWASFVLGNRKEALIALDWTEYEPDDHTTLAAYLVTDHGRATPLAWKTVKKSTLKGKQTEYEFEMVERLHDAIPTDVDIELLADRGFGNQELYETLMAYGWDFTIRFRGTIVVEHKGEVKPAKDWLPSSGRATKLSNAKVTRDRTQVGAVVVVRDKKMKDAWFLATSRADRSAAQTVKRYSRRFTIEETFRDQKDPRFGMGLRATHIRDAGRRDRLLMLLAIAHALLTLLGAASERSGLDRYLKVNTVKRRTHSLFRQGSYWYQCLPTMRDEWFERLMSAFEEVLAEHDQMTQIVGSI